MGHDRRMAKQEDGWSRKVEVDMSTIMVKGKMAERVQKLQLEDEEQPLGAARFLNSCDRCIICGFGRAFDIQTRMIEPLVGHHVKYFPAVVAWVHYHCHRKIHDTDNPITVFIQYEENDARKYYEKKAVRHTYGDMHWQ